MSVTYTSGPLDTDKSYIKYKINITENSQDVANNTTNVTVAVNFYRTSYYEGGTYGTGTVYCIINGTTYSQSVTPSQKVTTEPITLFTKTLNISHNSDGSKYLGCSAKIIHETINSGYHDYSHQLTTIPRKSILTVSSGALGVAQTLTADRKSSSFTHTLTYKCGNHTGTIGSEKTSSTSWNFTPPLGLADVSPNDTRVYCEFTLKTFSGSTLVGYDNKSAWLTIPSSVIPSRTLTLGEPTGQNHVSTYGGYIQGKSKLKVTVNTSGIYGSTIKKTMTVVQGITYYETVFTSSTLSTSGTKTITNTTTDSRGRSATTPSYSIVVMPYSAPNISVLKVGRCNSDGSDNDQGLYTKVTISYTVTNFNKTGYTANKIGSYLKYKKTTESSWSSIHLTDPSGSYYSTFHNYSVSNASIIISTPDDSVSYDVRLELSDFFTNVSKQTSVSTGYTLMHFSTSGKGIGIGKMSESDIFDIGMPTTFRSTPKIGDNDIGCVIEQGNTNLPYYINNVQIGTVSAYYRKWNNRIKEIWGVFDKSIAVTNTDSGTNFYRSDVIEIRGIGYLYSPVCNFSGGDYMSFFDHIKPFQISKDYITFRVISDKSYTTSGSTTNIFFHVIGFYE